MSNSPDDYLDTFKQANSWPYEFVLSKQFAYFINQIPEAVFISDESGNIVQCNNEATKLAGYPLNELLQLTIEELVPPNKRDGHSKMREMFFKRPFSRWMGESRIRLSLYTKTEDSIAIDAILFSLLTDKGVLAINFIRDITTLEEEKERLVKQGTYDALTGLPNRYYLYDRFKELQAEARRENKTIVVILMDLDKFKPVNDNFGHAVGDKLLQALAQRFKKRLRGNDFIARLGGDEFVFMNALDNFSETLPQKLLDTVSEPFLIDGVEHQVGISMGVVAESSYQKSLADLLGEADDRLYEAKHQGGNCYVTRSADE